MGDSAIFMIAALAFISVAGVGWVIAGGQNNRANSIRLRSLTARDQMKRGKRKMAALDQSSARRKQLQETLKDLDQHQKEQRKRTITLKSRIQQAGFSFSPTAFHITTLSIGLGVALAMILVGQTILVALAFGFGAGFGLPRWFLGFVRKRRVKKFSLEFANAIDVIVRGIKSGLPLNECLRIIAREAPAPVGPEFQKLVEGMTVGVDLSRGLEKMYERMPLSELNFFTIVLTIQQKTGGNLAEALGNLSIVLRARKMMREKIGALSSEAKASSGIIGSLPPLVMTIVYLTTPEYMGLMFTEDLGRLMLAGAGIWMGLGIFVMSRMIAFDF
jgi:tight adherence protein B